MTENKPDPLLILGGTSEGYALADRLVQAGMRTISSLAGRTKLPRVPAGGMRVGGFGGAEGLATWLVEHGVRAVIDATHPFAKVMGWNAARACERTDVPLVRLERPAWQPQQGDSWMRVDTWEEAATLLASHRPRVFLTLGRQELDAFAGLNDAFFLIRSVDAPNPMPPFENFELVQARGPFSYDDEYDLLRRYRIDTLVCKDSGGEATRAKLDAARDLGVQIIMRRRPPRPETARVCSVEEAYAWVERLP